MYMLVNDGTINIEDYYRKLIENLKLICTLLIATHNEICKLDTGVARMDNDVIYDETNVNINSEGNVINSNPLLLENKSGLLDNGTDQYHFNDQPLYITGNTPNTMKNNYLDKTNGYMNNGFNRTQNGFTNNGFTNNGLNRTQFGYPNVPGKTQNDFMNTYIYNNNTRVPINKKEQSTCKSCRKNDFIEKDDRIILHLCRCPCCKEKEVLVDLNRSKIILTMYKDYATVHIILPNNSEIKIFASIANVTSYLLNFE